MVCDGTDRLSIPRIDGGVSRCVGELTVGLDVHGEKLAVRAVTQLTDGRTVNRTPHRPALTRLANRTVYLHRGGEVEEISTPPREEAR